jgi:hypothetical protein
MTAFQRSDRSCRMAANDNDGFMGVDVAPPNPHAQRRGHQLVIAFVLLAGVVALVAGLSEGTHDAFAAFPNADALLLASAWGRFFDALGQIATIGLAIIGAALVLRWLLRRRRA